MPYQKSLYNLLVPYPDGRTIIFNAFSGALGLFQPDTLRRYQENKLSAEEEQTLVKKGILVPEGTDEKSLIHQDRANGILHSKEKLIRLWTTSACNARCYYCFEKGISPVTMTEATAEQVIAFILPMLQEGDTLTFEWFGGEPLLNPGIIDYIVGKLTPSCQRLHCRLQSAFISNGSLIDAGIVRKMKTTWNTKYVQITLDGDRKTYHAVKDYICPEKHNFDNVLHNIKLLAKSGIHVSIRMNYDTTNYESLLSLIDYLHQELGNYHNIFYYVYPLWSCLNEEAADPFHSTTTADQNLIALFDRIVQYGMTPPRLLARLNYKKNQCSSCSASSYAVFPDGKLGKCSETFLQSIGDVWNGVTDPGTFSRWTDIGLDPVCDACIYLPLCQGGCRSSLFTKMPRCFAYKDILPELLVWYVSKLLERRSIS